MLIPDQRHGPRKCAHALTKQEKQEIVKIATNKEFRDMSPNKIVPIIADRGAYIASERSFYRVLKEHQLLQHRGRTRLPKKRVIPTVTARKPNEVWSWDITYLKGPIKGEFLYLYLIMDLYSRMIIGWRIHHEQTAENASMLIDQCCKDFKVKRSQLILHSDNGGPMKGATMLATLQKLGIIPSFSRPRVSNDNPFSESLFKTLKYHPNYPYKRFKDLHSASQWMIEFADWYNNKHLHSEIKYVTPSDRHYGKDDVILSKRQEVYAMAKKQHPIRFNTGARDWKKIEVVYLNPQNKVEHKQAV